MKKIVLLLCILPQFIFSQRVNLNIFEPPGCLNKHFSQIKQQESEIALLHNYDVTFYGLDLEVTNENDHVKGNVTIKAKVVNEPLTNFVIQLIDQLQIDKILFNHEEVSFTHENNLIGIELNNNISTNEFFEVQIFYQGKSGEEGMQHAIDQNWGFPVTYTLSETWHAKEWFPCKEVLSDKADSVYVFITTNSNCKAAGNGMLNRTVYLPNGKIRYEWKSNLKTAYYLIFVIVADYQEYNIYAHPAAAQNPVLIQNYLYDHPFCLEYYKPEIDITATMLELLSEKYGLYPFHAEKYGHAMWPWGGAMEHQTMTTTGTFDFGYTSHELGHSWFGDYVTCASWQDIWINEGFASYSEYITIENIAQTHYAVDHLNYAEERARRATEGSIYIAFEDVTDESVIFNYNITYRKGLLLVHMIRYLIDNDDLFFTVLRNFLNQYANSVARGIDFKAVLEETTGIDFTNFFNQWFFGEGYPVYHLAWNQSGNNVTLNITQETTSESTPFFDIPIEVRFYGNGQNSTRKFTMNSNTESYNFALNFPIDSIQIDPDNWILNGEGSIINSLHHLNQNLQECVNIYPNPANNETTIEINNSSGQSFELSIITTSNQILRTEKFTCKKQKEEHKLVLNNIPNGVYFIILKSNNSIVSKKLMKFSL